MHRFSRKEKKGENEANLEATIKENKASDCQIGKSLLTLGKSKIQESNRLMTAGTIVKVEDLPSFDWPKLPRTQGISIVKGV